jgi:ribosome-binding protein aMBF1 (putative translation factor)
MSYQDWKQVNIGNKTLVKKSPSPKNVQNNGFNTNGITIKKIYDPNEPNAEPEILPVMIEKEFGRKIVKARTAKGMNQQQFATALSLPLHTIKEYEAGKGVRNGSIVDKINRWIAKNC